MPVSKLAFFLEDNGGRRSRLDRRQFSYNAHVPERRCGQDRRSGKDRRSGIEQRKVTGVRISVDRRSGVERRAAFG